MKNAQNFINGESYNRSAGILLPIFSLPSKYGIGDFGYSAYKFIDFLRSTNQTLWAILPLGHTGYCNSPYKAVSAFAGNPYFISPEILIKRKLIKSSELKKYNFGKDKDIDYGILFSERYKFLHEVYENWKKYKFNQLYDFKQFKKENSFWLNDYCLFMSLKEKFNFKPWNTWDEDISKYEAKAILKYKKKLKSQIKFWEFVQYEYYNQFKSLKKYANDCGIRLIGDMPFYVEYDSVDVWSNRNLFAIDINTNKIIKCAGVPGDIFSKHSRNWGMPCYDWDEIKKTNYQWHLKKFEQYTKLYNIVRIDHALGFVRYYGISDSNEQWYEGPDFSKDTLIPKITKLMKKHSVEIIAEDLGSVPDRAYYLFNKYNWASTRVLQFGFANKYGTETIHLPFYYPHKSVAYSSTHDNQTLLSYINNMKKENKIYINYYLNSNIKTSKHKIQEKMIEELYRSASEKVLIPLADILELDNSARISHGKEYEKSWRWRLNSLKDINKSKRIWLKKMTFAYARTPFSIEEGKTYGWNWK